MLPKDRVVGPGAASIARVAGSDDARVPGEQRLRLEDGADVVTGSSRDRAGQSFEIDAAASERRFESSQLGRRIA